MSHKQIQDVILCRIKENKDGEHLILNYNEDGGNRIHLDLEDFTCPDLMEAIAALKPLLFEVLPITTTSRGDVFVEGVGLRHDKDGEIIAAKIYWRLYLGESIASQGGVAKYDHLDGLPEGALPILEAIQNTAIAYLNAIR